MAKSTYFHAGLTAGKVLSVSAPACECPLNAAKTGAACECGLVTITVEDSRGGVRLKSFREDAPEVRTARAALSKRSDGSGPYCRRIEPPSVDATPKQHTGAVGGPPVTKNRKG